MLTGRWGDTTGRPYIEGRLLRGYISFCIDTGADRTILMPSDSVRMKLDFDLLSRPTRAVGLGGQALLFDERARLAFSEPPNRIYVYDLDVKIAADDDQIGDVPSLLGRDILNRWRVDYNPVQNSLRMRVLSADGILSSRRRR